MATSVLRRRLSGDFSRKGRDDLLLRRRSLRARTDRAPQAHPGDALDRRLDEGLDGAGALPG